MLARNNNWRGAKTILGENRRHSGLIFDRNDEQIFATRLFDIGFGNP